MEVAFATKALRTVCESTATAADQFGAEVAGQLRNRIADILAASTIDELPAGNPHLLHAGRNMAVDLSNGYRILFCANHTKVPMDGNGKVDWSKVTRIRLLRIEVDNE